MRNVLLVPDRPSDDAAALGAVPAAPVIAAVTAFIMFSNADA
jgi:hypothetical protein